MLYGNSMLFCSGLLLNFKYMGRLFLIAILSTISFGFHNWLFMSAASQLTAVLRKMTFKSILRQDIGFFDREENSVCARDLVLYAVAEKLYRLDP